MSAERMQNRLVELSPESDVAPSVQRGSYDPYGVRGGNCSGFIPGKSSKGPYASMYDLIEALADDTPGPGKYYPKGTHKGDGGSGNESGGGKFSTAVPKSDIEWTEYRAKQLPGPGEYQTVMASKGKLGLAPRTVTFAAGNPKSDLDWTIYRSRQLPGPGQYTHTADTIGRRAGPPTMAVNRSPTRSFSGMGQVQQESEEKLRRLERKADALKLAMTPDPLARSPYETAAYEHVQKLKEDVMRALIRSGKSRASSKGTSASGRLRSSVEFLEMDTNSEDGETGKFMETAGPYVHNTMHRSGASYRRSQRYAQALRTSAEVLAEGKQRGSRRRRVVQSGLKGGDQVDPLLENLIESLSKLSPRSGTLPGRPAAPPAGKTG